MLNWFRARGANARKAKELYGAVVAAARQREFYSDYGVPDTLNGRFEMIVIVLFQLLERLRREGAACEVVSRLTLEAFFTDMDDCMREIGIGDLSVPKKVKKAAAGFYERASTYRAAIDAGDQSALAAALEAFIAADGVVSAPGAEASRAAGGSQQTRAGFERLAAHVFARRDRLAAAGIDEVLAGRALAPQH